MQEIIKKHIGEDVQLICFDQMELVQEYFPLLFEIVPYKAFWVGSWSIAKNEIEQILLNNYML